MSHIPNDVALLSEILEVRQRPLVQAEIWALLLESLLAFKNILSKNVDPSRLLRLTHTFSPGSIMCGLDGRVKYAVTSETTSAAKVDKHYRAPEFSRKSSANSQKQIEKMFIYSLGMCAFASAENGALTNNLEISVDLETLLCSMVEENYTKRISHSFCLQICQANIDSRTSHNFIKSLAAEIVGPYGLQVSPDEIPLLLPTPDSLCQTRESQDSMRRERADSNYSRLNFDAKRISKNKQNQYQEMTLPRLDTENTRNPDKDGHEKLPRSPLSEIKDSFSEIRDIASKNQKNYQKPKTKNVEKVRDTTKDIKNLNNKYLKDKHVSRYDKDYIDEKPIGIRKTIPTNDYTEEQPILVRKTMSTNTAPTECSVSEHLEPVASVQPLSSKNAFVINLSRPPEQEKRVHQVISLRRNSLPVISRSEDIHSSNECASDDPSHNDHGEQAPTTRAWSPDFSTPDFDKLRSMDEHSKNTSESTTKTFKKLKKSFKSMPLLTKPLSNQKSIGRDDHRKHEERKPAMAQKSSTSITSSQVSLTHGTYKLDSKIHQKLNRFGSECSLQSNCSDEPQVQHSSMPSKFISNSMEDVGPEFILVTSDPDTAVVDISPPRLGPLPKGSRNVAVILLNGQKLLTTILVSSQGKDLFEVITKHLNIKETKYFGLTQKQEDEHVFLDFNTKLSKYAPLGWKEENVKKRKVEFVLHLKVKILVDASLLKHSLTRHLFYLQTRRDLLMGHLHGADDQLFSLAGIALQAEYGDHRHIWRSMAYFKLEHYLPPNILARHEKADCTLSRLHQDNYGMSTDQAESEFLNQAKDLPEYGVLFHKVFRSKKNEEDFVWLGVCLDGIVVLEPKGNLKAQVHQQKWDIIKEFNFQKKKFTVNPKKADEYPSMLFYTNHYRRSKYLFNLCQTFHRFNAFNLQKTPIAKKKTLNNTGCSETNQIRVVSVSKQPFERLGLTVVGGGGEEVQKGIFIKHIKPGSVCANRDGLKTGYRIISVNGYNLQQATHKEAVTAIQNAGSKVEFVVETTDYMKLDVQHNFKQCTDVAAQFDGIDLTDDAMTEDTQYSERAVDVETLPTVVTTISSRPPIKPPITRQRKAKKVHSPIVKRQLNNAASVSPVLKHNSVKLTTSSLKQSNDASPFVACKNNDSTSKDHHSSHTNEIQNEFADDNQISSHDSFSYQKQSHNQQSELGQQGGLKRTAGFFGDLNNISGEQLDDTFEMTFDDRSITPLAGITRETIEEIEVTLGKKNGTYGLSIMGGMESSLPLGGVYVKALHPQGAALETGRIRQGDRILSVNGVSLENVSHVKAAEILKSAPTPTAMVLDRGIVVSPEPCSNRLNELTTVQARDLIFEVDVLKNEQGELGLSLVGGQGGDDVFNGLIMICRMFAGESMERSGMFHVGDILLIVNDQIVEGLSLQQTLNVIRNAPRKVHIVAKRPPPEEIPDCLLPSPADVRPLSPQELIEGLKQLPVAHNNDTTAGRNLTRQLLENMDRSEPLTADEKSDVLSTEENLKKSELSVDRSKEVEDTDEDTEQPSMSFQHDQITDGSNGHTDRSCKIEDFLPDNNSCKEIPQEPQIVASSLKECYEERPSSEQNNVESNEAISLPNNSGFSNSPVLASSPSEMKVKAPEEQDNTATISHEDLINTLQDLPDDITEDLEEVVKPSLPLQNVVTSPTMSVKSFNGSPALKRLDGCRQSVVSSAENTPNKNNCSTGVIIFVQLEKGEGGLGITLSTNENEGFVYIKKLVPGGEAEKCGKLMPGDRLVRVNGRCVEESSQKEVVDMFRTLSGTISVECFRPPVIPPSPRVAGTPLLLPRPPAEPGILSLLTTHNFTGVTDTFGNTDTFGSVPICSDSSFSSGLSSKRSSTKSNDSLKQKNKPLKDFTRETSLKETSSLKQKSRSLKESTRETNKTSSTHDDSENNTKQQNKEQKDSFETKPSNIFTKISNSSQNGTKKCLPDEVGWSDDVTSTNDDVIYKIQNNEVKNDTSVNNSNIGLPQRVSKDSHLEEINTSLITSETRNSQRSGIPLLISSHSPHPSPRVENHEIKIECKSTFEERFIEREEFKYYTHDKLTLCLQTIKSKIENIDNEYLTLRQGVRVLGSCDIGNRASNRVKNRHKSIIPYDENRVQLNGSEESDYINASHVQIPIGDEKLNYIVTQAPLENTIGDFWRFIWESKCDLVVMLNQNNETKCPIYWPNVEEAPLKFFEKFELCNIYEEEKPAYIFRQFKVTNIKLGKSMFVTQVAYREWPELSMPRETGEFLSFMKFIESYRTSSSPIVVHCSTGVHRSMAYLVMESVWWALENDKRFDVFKICRCIKEQRQNSLQSKDHFLFCLQATKILLTELISRQ